MGGVSWPWVVGDGGGAQHVNLGKNGVHVPSIAFCPLNPPHMKETVCMCTVQVQIIK
jgi:hypothetical protein